MNAIEKTCLHCGGMMNRRQQARAKFCSSTCSNSYHDLRRKLLGRKPTEPGRPKAPRHKVIRP
jgi:hypothetical protein